jgi:hypothetical protein
MTEDSAPVPENCSEPSNEARNTSLEAPRPRPGSYESMLGRWPGDINDGFEEFIRELRKGPRRESPP